MPDSLGNWRSSLMSKVWAKGVAVDLGGVGVEGVERLRGPPTTVHRFLHGDGLGVLTASWPTTFVGDRKTDLLRLGSTSASGISEPDETYAGESDELMMFVIAFH